MPNTTQQDYYETLGVKNDATEEEIRSAYRDLARKYHPDKTGGDETAEEKLKEISAAYDVLKNADKRKKYDQQRVSAAHGFGGFDFTGASSGGDDFADILSSLFGGGARAQAYTAARPGRNLQARIKVTLKDAVSGTSKTLRIRRDELCADCKGSGAAPGTSPITCPDCGGAGQISRGNGMFQMRQTCSRCRGTGEAVATPCPKCSGSGHTRARREIAVTIPPGVDEGTRLRIAGEGDAGHYGGPRGDLYVHVIMEKDPFFLREGRNLICEVPVTFATAALGAKIDVPTLDGVAKVTVQPGTQNGTLLRMRGMGLPSLSGTSRGDELIKILVEVPKKLTRDQIKLLRDFDDPLPATAHPLREKFRKRLAKLRGRN